MSPGMRKSHVKAISKLEKRKTYWTLPFASIVLDILSMFSILSSLIVLGSEYHYCHFISDKNKIQSTVYVA